MRFFLFFFFFLHLTLLAQPLQVSMGSYSGFRTGWQSGELALVVAGHAVKHQGYIGIHTKKGHHWQALIGSRYAHTTPDAIYDHTGIPISYYGLRYQKDWLTSSLDIHEKASHLMLSWQDTVIMSGYIETHDDQDIQLLGLTATIPVFFDHTLTCSGYKGTIYTQDSYGLHAKYTHTLQGFLKTQAKLSIAFEQWWSKEQPDITNHYEFLTAFDEEKYKTRYNHEPRYTLGLTIQKLINNIQLYSRLRWLSSPELMITIIGCQLKLSPRLRYQMQIENGTVDELSLVVSLHVLTRIPV